MRRQRSLPVGGSLHCPENLFEVPAQPPRVRPRRFCKAHLAKHGEARDIMSCARSRRFAQPGLRRIPRDREMLRSQVRAGFAARLFRSLRSIDVSRFSVTSRRSASAPSSSVRYPSWRVHRSAAIRPNPLLHILAAQAQSLAAISHATNHHVNMRVLGVVVFSRNPFEIRSQILLHLRDQFARQPRQIDPVPKFRRDDQLPELLIARGLPVCKLPRDVDRFVLPAESHGFGVVFKCRALAREITPVCFPLPSDLVLQIRHADRATLMVRTRGFSLFRLARGCRPFGCCGRSA